MTHISELIPDKKNARRHPQRNMGMIMQSLQEVGAARSIVIDENNEILAGNGVVEAAGQVGIENVVIIPADGNTLYAIQRTGLTQEQKTRLALFDNRAGELAEWDGEELSKLFAEEFDFTGLFFDNEIESLIADIPAGEDWADSIGALPEGDRAPFQQMTFTLSDEQAEEVKRAIDAAKAQGAFIDTGNENSNGNALARVCMDYVTRYGG
jgi:hypothetical protein